MYFPWRLQKSGYLGLGVGGVSDGIYWRRIDSDGNVDFYS